MPFVKSTLLSVIIICLITITSGSKLEDLLDLEYVLKGLEEHNSQCGLHMKEYLNGLTTGKQWALKMQDSSANKLDEKFVHRNAYINGYEECLDNKDPPEDFGTHYCVLNLYLHQGDNATVLSVRPTFLIGVRVSQYFLINYGLCLPRSCGAVEIETALKDYFNRTTENDPSYLFINQDHCTTKEARPYSPLDQLTIAILTLLVLIAIASTAYDYTQTYFYNNDKPHPLYKSFSIWSNYKSLVKTTDSRLEALDGMRVISCFAIVLHHHYVILLYGPLQNVDGILDMWNSLNYFPIVNAHIANHTFLFMSGLLVANSFFKTINDKGYFDVPRQYIHRYLRLTPSYAIVILIHATIFGHFGEGPLWKVEAKYMMDDCLYDWWTWLTYIENYVYPFGTCMEHCWYLNVDMQLFWLSPFLLLPILYRPKLAPFILIIPTLIFAFTTFTISYVYDINAPLWSNTPFRWANEYVPTHTRGGPWMVGLAFGYILHLIKDKNITIQLSKLWVTIGWTLGALLCSLSWFGLILFLVKVSYTRFDNALYEGFHGIGWALGLAWIIFACEYGYGGPVNAFLSWKAWKPLSKLSFGVYLNHVVIQRFKMISARNPLWMGIQDISDMHFSIYIISTALAALQYIFVEMPFINLDKYVFRNVKIFPLPKSSKIRPETIGSIENGKQLDGSGNRKDITRVRPTSPNSHQY